MTASRFSHVMLGDLSETIFSKLSRTGDHKAIVYGDKNTLKAYDLAYSRVEPIFEASDIGVINFRTFARQGKPELQASESSSTEILFATGKRGEVARFDIEYHPHRICQALIMPKGGDEITCIQESSDGRYVAVADTEGYVAVWNFDIQDGVCATCIFCKKVGDANVMSMAFNRQNSVLYIVTSIPEQIMIDLTHGYIIPLHNNNGWPAFAVACHPEQGVAFAGDGNDIWLLDLKKAYQHNVPLGQIPFSLIVSYNVTGTKTETLPIGCRDKSCMAHIKTSIQGGFIHALAFVSKNEIAAIGRDEVEVWDITTGEMTAEESRLGQKPTCVTGNHGNIVIGWLE